MSGLFLDSGSESGMTQGWLSHATGVNGADTAGDLNKILPEMLEHCWDK